MSIPLFPLFGEPYDTALGTAAFVAAVGGWRPFRMLFRMARPVPEDDCRAIERAFQERGQRVTAISKRWVGGPWHYASSRMPIPYQGGRPYGVQLATGQETGALRVIAVEGKDARGDPIVHERRPDGWTTISKARPISEPLVLGADRT